MKYATVDQVAGALNEWMRRYIEEPERFAREITTIKEFNAAEAAGETPSYGTNSAPYLAKIVDDLYPGVTLCAKRKASK
jgi:hypothetical protein